MFKPSVVRQVARAARLQAPRAAFRPAQPKLASIRQFASTPRRFEKNEDEDEHSAYSTAGEPGESGDHEGQYARTREDIKVEYPEEKDLPPSKPVQGRGGIHAKRTLASFSMEGKTAVVTGGARGLGLVMAQALVTSGADVAIVDMNREEAMKSAEGLIELYKRENDGSDEYVINLVHLCFPRLINIVAIPRLPHTFATYRALHPSTSLWPRFFEFTAR